MQTSLNLRNMVRAPTEFPALIKQIKNRKQTLTNKARTIMRHVA